MKEYKFYLIHIAIQNFTEISFISFGSLLIYLKTGAILDTLIFGMTLKLFSMLIKSVLIKPYLTIARHFGVLRVMISCLLIWGLSLVGLFVIQPHGQTGTAIFYIIGLIYAIGHSGYWLLSNALGFSYVGLSKTPGTYSSYWQISTVIPGIIAALIGLLLNFKNNFLTMLLLMGLLLIISIIPLKFITPPKVRVISFKDCLKHVSTLGFWSNVNPEFTMINVAIPLIILISFGSLSKSILVTATTTMATITLVYLIGKSKDNKNNKPVIFSGSIMLIGLILYGLVSSPTEFIIVGTIIGITMSMVDTSRDASIGRELSNSHDSVAGTVAIEFARSFGGLLGTIILIIVYLISGSLWQPILIFGAFTTLPKIIYSIKNISEQRP